MQTRNSAKQVSAPSSNNTTSKTKSQAKMQAPSSYAAGSAPSSPAAEATTSKKVVTPDENVPALTLPLPARRNSESSIIIADSLNPSKASSPLVGVSLRILEVLALSLAFAILALTLSRFANVFILHYYAALPLKATVFIPGELHRKVERLLVPLREGGFGIASEAIAADNAVKPSQALGWSLVYLLCLGWIVCRFVVLVVAALRYIAQRWGRKVVAAGNTHVFGIALATWAWLYSGFW